MDYPSSFCGERFATVLESQTCSGIVDMERTKWVCTSHDVDCDGDRPVDCDGGGIARVKRTAEVSGNAGQRTKRGAQQISIYRAGDVFVWHNCECT